ncbi:MAG: hydrogenase nickel incorporation protein HypA [Desulfurococcaceae archaeon]|jgi:hydrogenase nickel incorporation protein HypA/HybF
MVHEWALAESIVLYVSNKGVRKARRIKVRIGALQSIDKEILSFALNELLKEYNIKVDNIEILEEQPVLKCNRCGFEWSIDTTSVNEDLRESIHFLPESIYAYYRCPKCGSVDYEILKGRGLGEVVIEDYE